MKVLACLIFKRLGDEGKPVLLAKAQDLTSFGYFTRSTVAEHLLFGARTVVQRTNPGTRQSVSLDESNPFLCHTHVRPDSLCGVVVSDKEYPQRVAFVLINQMLEQFEKTSKNAWREEKTAESADEPDYLVRELTRYQDPHQADKLLKIQSNLEDIKGIMHKNIDEVLRRGEKLDDLMERAEDLSATSVQFYKQSKKTNQCCQMY